MSSMTIYGDKEMVLNGGWMTPTNLHVAKVYIRLHEPATIYRAFSYGEGEGLEFKLDEYEFDLVTIDRDNSSEYYHQHKIEYSFFLGDDRVLSVTKLEWIGYDREQLKRAMIGNYMRVRDNAKLRYESAIISLTKLEEL